MKILAITHQLDRTGAPIVLFKLLEILKDAGYDIEIMSMKEGELSNEAKRLGFPFSIRPRFLHDYENFINIAKEFDLVIVNTLAAFEAIHALKTTDISVLWWLHENDNIFEFLKDLIPDFKELPDNIRVFAVSIRVQEYLKIHYGFNADILPIPVDDIPSDHGTVLGINDKIRFVTVGTYSKVKGQDILAKSIRGISDKLIDSCEFLFCGNEEVCDPEIIESVRSLCKDYENVKMLGSLPREEVLSLIESADCLIVPSRDDPLPTVAIEAMMKETLLLCTDGCGVSLYMRDGKDGFVVPADNTKALTKAIEEIIANSACYDEIRKTGRDIYLNNYSSDVVLPKILTLVGNLSSRARLIIFVGMYDILDIFAYKLEESFKSMGYEVFIFDSRDMQKSLGMMAPFIDKPVRAVITLNNLGYNMELREGHIIWDDLGIPIINILMDHPFCYKNALDNSPISSIVLSPDKNHMRYIQRFFPNIPVSGFLAHGGIEVQRDKKSIKDRKYDVIYTGSLSRSFADKSLPEFKKYKDFDAKKLFWDAYENCINNPHKTTEGAIEEEINKLGLTYSEEELSEIISDLYIVDLYIVSHFREAVVKAVALSGIDIELYGFGWEVCDWINMPNVHYGGRIPADEVLYKMLDTKIVLSTMTWFKDGTHDRVFNGMLAGAVTVSDESVYMNEEFIGRYDGIGEDNREMVLFSLNEIESFTDTIKDLLCDTNKAQGIADRGYLRAKSRHTWESRAWEIEQEILSQLS